MANTIINPPLLINKNYFKNPNFAVIQGTASGTLANSKDVPTASLGYSGETEWFTVAAGGTPAYAFSAINENVTITGAAGTTEISLGQRIESRDMTTLANRLATMTLSVELSNSLLTTVQWFAFRPSTTDDTFGTFNALTATTIASGSFTVSSTLTRYSATFTLPALATRGVEIRLKVLAQTSGTWVVSRLQLEENSVASNFNCSDYSKSLQTCQRYFQLANCSLQAPAVGNAWVTMMFPTPMSAVPVRTNINAGSALNAAVSFENQTAVSYNLQINVTTASGSVTNRTNSYAAHIP